jgi:methyltransferase family protein
MLGLPFHYLLKHPVVGVTMLTTGPLEVWTTVQETYIAERERRGPQCQYEADENWERWLHDRLGLQWPCPFTSDFQVLWSEVVTELESKGIRPGPESFGSWNDGDAGLVRAIWCLTRHLRPANVVETGVAHGFTSRFILEALERNGNGHLSSIDLPPIERSWHSQVGMAVGGRYADRWSYIKGSSRLRLPKLLSRLGEIDLFIHDSMHSEHNVRFELDRVWAYLRLGGALVVDDIDANWGFRSFTKSFSGHRSVICEAEPLHPDLRRFNNKGLFGIILKEPTALA